MNLIFDIGANTGDYTEHFSRLADKVNVRGVGIGHGGSFKVQELHMKQIFSPIIHCKTKSILYKKRRAWLAKDDIGPAFSFAG